MRRRVLALPAALVFSAAVGCFAQQLSIISVRLTDVTGASLSGAHVLLRANIPKVVVTDVTATAGEGVGEYSAALKPGIYDVFVSAPCVVPFVTQIEVSEGKPEILPVQMKPQYDLNSASMSDCPTPDDFGTPIDFDIYEPPLPDRIPYPTSGDGRSETVK
jgi:hypothetical protein